MASLNCALASPPRQRSYGFRPPIHCAADRQLLFNNIAPVYDNLNDLLSLGQHRVWKRMSVSWSGAKKGDCVLDVCCGSGDLAFLLSDTVGVDGKVIGLDFSKELLTIASSRQKSKFKACYKNIEWIKGDALKLPFDDCFFDAVTMGYGLRNVLDRNKAMKELYRVLKPGCGASVLDFNKSTAPFSASIREWLIDNIIVPVGGSFGLSEEYRYLKSSVEGYLTGNELEQLAMDAGFCNAKFYEIGGGAMGNLVAFR